MRSHFTTLLVGWFQSRSLSDLTGMKIKETQKHVLPPNKPDSTKIQRQRQPMERQDAITENTWKHSQQDPGKSAVKKINM